MTPSPQHASSQSSTKPCSQEEPTNKSARRALFQTIKPKEIRRKLINKPCLSIKKRKETEIRICGAEGNTTSSVGVHWTGKMQIRAERHSRKLVSLMRGL